MWRATWPSWCVLEERDGHLFIVLSLLGGVEMLQGIFHSTHSHGDTWHGGSGRLGGCMPGWRLPLTSQPPQQTATASWARAEPTRGRPAWAWRAWAPASSCGLPGRCGPRIHSPIWWISWVSSGNGPTCPRAGFGNSAGPARQRISPPFCV